MVQNPYNRGTAWVAQLVEHSPEEGRVGSSSLPPSTYAKAPTYVGAFARLFPLPIQPEKVLKLAIPWNTLYASTEFPT